MKEIERLFKELEQLQEEMRQKEIAGRKKVQQIELAILEMKNERRILIKVVEMCTSIHQN